MYTTRKASQFEGLKEKERRIVQLEWQLQAQAAKSSLLQTRLASTLDAMDVLKHEHEREVSAERQAKEKAREKLQRFMEYASSIEQERDEYRNGLQAVVEKVEENSDLSTWPHSRMRLPSALEPLEDVADPRKSGAAETGAHETNEHTKFIVSSLRADLEKERVSHTRTHQQAETEIGSLRAQLARREAELEACTVHQDHASLLASAVHSEGALPSQEHHIELSQAFTPEEAVEILGLRVAKNKELEMEVKQLSAKLHQARLESLASKHDEGENPSDQPHASHHPHGPTVQFLLKSPDLRPYSPNDILSPYSMTPRNAATPRVTKSASHLRLSHLSESNPDNPLKSVLIQRLEEESHWPPDPSSTPPERHLLSPSDISSQVTAVPTEHEPHLDLAAPHDEAIALRAELARVQDEAAGREAELRAEITALHDALAQRVPAPVPVPIVGTLLDDGEGEQSMDLGTPLAPTAVFWGVDDVAVPLAAEQEGDEQVCTGGAEPAEGNGEQDADHRDCEEADLPLRIPLPPSPDSSFADADAPTRPRTLHDRPPTPFTSDASQAEIASDADDGGAPPTEASESVASPNRRPAVSGCACAERLLAVEKELQETTRAIAQRDEEIVALRIAVNELRLATLGR